MALLTSTSTSIASSTSTSSFASQYLQPEYLQPITSSAVETKPSPLTLLVQTCNNIGKDQQSSKVVGCATPGNVETNCITSAGLGCSSLSSAARKSSSCTPPTTNFRSGRKDSTKSGLQTDHCCGDVVQMDDERCNGSLSTSGSRHVSDDNCSRHRGQCRPRSTGSGDRRKNDATAAEVEFNQLPSSKPTKSDDSGRNGQGVSQALRRSSSSKFASGACSPQAGYLPSRPCYQDFDAPFHMAVAETANGNEAVELSPLSATVNGALNPSSVGPLASTLAQLYGAAMNGSVIPESLSSATDSLTGRYLPPSFGSGLIQTTSSSSSSSASLHNLLNGASQFPPLSSLMTPSGLDSANSSSGLGIHSLLQQALTLAYYQQCYRRYGSDSAGGDIFSPETVPTNQRHPTHCVRPPSPSRPFTIFRHPAGQSAHAVPGLTSCPDPSCVRCRLVDTSITAAAISAATAATKNTSTSSGSAVDDPPCCISGCCCRQGAVAAQRHSPLSFNSASGSVSDRDQRRPSCLPFPSISGQVDSSSLFTSSPAASASPSMTTFSAVAAALSSLCRQPTDLLSGSYDVTSASNGFSSADVHHRHVCSWLNASTGNYCGRRFATVESLLHHLQSHCVDQQPAPAALAAASLLFSQQASAAAAAFQSTGNGFPPSLPSSAASGYSVDFTTLLQMSRPDQFRSSSSSNRSDGVAVPSSSSRYHPYQLPTSYGATGAAARRHSSSTSGYEPPGPILQSVCSESAIPRSPSGGVQQLLQRHRPLNTAMVGGGSSAPVISAAAMRL